MAHAYRRALRSGVPEEDLRDQQRDWANLREDAAFKQRTFDEALVKHGSVAVKHLRRYLLGG